MSLKKRIKAAAQDEKHRLTKGLAGLGNADKVAERLGGVDLANISLYVFAQSSSPSIVISCLEDGQARDVASMLSAELDIQFTKAFDTEAGEHDYTAHLDGCSVRVSGSPPTSCNMRLITKKVRVYEVDCENAAELAEVGS